MHISHITLQLTPISPLEKVVSQYVPSLLIRRPLPCRTLLLNMPMYRMNLQRKRQRVFNDSLKDTRVDTHTHADVHTHGEAVWWYQVITQSDMDKVGSTISFVV